MSEGFILCIANEGLTDFTTVIWRFTEYAIKHKRSLIIDKTRYKEDSLYEVFDFKNWPVPVYTVDHLCRVEHDTVEPIEFLKYLTYEDKHITKARYNCWLTFDTEKEYPNNVLLVHAAGKGPYNKSHHFFRHVGFTPDFIRFLKEKMNELPPTYNVSHIRHTDYTVNIEETYGYIERLMNSSDLPLYVATDNTSVLKILIKKYGSRIYCNSSVLGLPDASDEINLHFSGKRFTLHNAVLDLFILAKGANNVIKQYIESQSTPHGYTKLAAELHSNTGFIDRILS